MTPCKFCDRDWEKLTGVGTMEGDKESKSSELGVKMSLSLVNTR